MPVNSNQLLKDTKLSQNSPKRHLSYTSKYCVGVVPLMCYLTKILTLGIGFYALCSSLQLAQKSTQAARNQDYFSRLLKITFASFFNSLLPVSFHCHNMDEYERGNL